MLAWVIKIREHAGEARLWTRMRDLYPAVAERIGGSLDASFDDLCARVLEQQGAPITPNKLMQRADKTERYFEFNELCSAVESAYEEIVNAA